MKSVDHAGEFRVFGCQFSDVFENLLPRREACFVTGLVQFGTPEDGHMNRIVPVRQKENAGCVLGHIGFGYRQHQPPILLGRTHKVARVEAVIF
jgi:hypothetical protein